MAKSVLVAKAQLGSTQVQESALPPLADGAARLRVESFAVTANNVTYAVIGDMFGYWNFFPALDGWGIIPMWGHARVEASNNSGLMVGERLYGYLPMGTHLDVALGNLSPGSFTDMAPHRQPMSPFYNQYSRIAADPEHDPAREDARMLFGPLFKTGFLIEAMMRREGWFTAEQMIMTSASSKTSLALAHNAKASSPDIKRIGLTSSGNVDFVRGTGLYDAVFSYDACRQIAQRPSVIVDFAGNAGVLRDVHSHLAASLTYSCLVGATHVEGRGGNGEPLPGPAPILFFAPDHAATAIAELGTKGFAAAVGKSWQAFVAQADGFITVAHRDGPEAARDAFLAILRGTADPATGIVVRP